MLSCIRTSCRSSGKSVCRGSHHPLPGWALPPARRSLVRSPRSAKPERNAVTAMSKSHTHHMLTPEGKQAATEARRKWVSEQPPTGTPAVFVVRLAGAMPFGWEIRKFGSFVLSKSGKGYANQAEAEAIGQEALESMAVSEQSKNLGLNKPVE